MFEEDDISLLLTLLDRLAEGQHGEGRGIEIICRDHGWKVKDVHEAHRRVSEALGIDDEWGE